MRNGRTWLIRVLALIGVVAAAYVQPLRIVKFLGLSMKPTYDDGSLALASSAFGDLSVGDVVVIDIGQGPMVKRVASVAGDRYWEVNTFGTWRPARTGSKHPNRAKSRQVTIPPGYIFVLGDNADLSYDSRQFGLVPLKAVKAKLIDPREPLAVLAQVRRAG